MIFLDNDVIHKLAFCDLLDETFNLISPHQQIYILDTAKYVLPNKIKKKKQNNLLPSIEQFIEKVRCHVPTNTSLISKLIDANQNIDEGEAILLEGLISHQESLFFTGDKRCLKAVVLSEVYRQYQSELSGKAVCFEQIILWLIEKKGFEFVQEKILLVRDNDGFDKSLKSIFSHSATKETIEDGLGSYIDDLKKESSDLLISYINF